MDAKARELDVVEYRPSHTTPEVQLSSAIILRHASHDDKLTTLSLKGHRHLYSHTRLFHMR